VSLPDLCDLPINAKVDTGARTSSLHAFALQRFLRDGEPWVRFEVHPLQRSKASVTVVEYPVHDERAVRSSTGHQQHRFVIRTPVRLGDDQWEIDLTLTRRDEMGFRMLLGREAVRRRFQIDPGRSYLAGKAPEEVSALKQRAKATGKRSAARKADDDVE
jgi:hypothetical protein